MTELKETPKSKLPTDAKSRKDAPMARGLLDYFPAACAAVAELSRIGNEQHNPGQPMHWAREKSTDHADCIVRHLVERGEFDTDGVRHSAKVAWRALAMLQVEIEDAATQQRVVGKSRRFSLADLGLADVNENDHELIPSPPLTPAQKEFTPTRTQQEQEAQVFKVGDRVHIRRCELRKAPSVFSLYGKWAALRFSDGSAGIFPINILERVEQ